jgi:hypothetical protein
MYISKFLVFPDMEMDIAWKRFKHCTEIKNKQKYLVFSLDEMRPYDQAKDSLT